MTEKGLLTRSERFRAHVYEGGLPKEQTQRQLATDLLRRAFEGSAASLVMRESHTSLLIPRSDVCTSLVTPKGATSPNNGEQTIWQKEPFPSATAGKRCVTNRGPI